MKKSILNLALSLAISSAVFSGSTVASETDSINNINSNNKTTETYMLPGMAAGAASGAVVAGPVGLLFGGIIGAVVGSNQDKTKDDNNILTTVSVAEQESTHPVLSDNPQQDIQLAQIGPVNSIVNDDINSHQEKIMNILVTDLSLDVYFRSGSTEIESFYPVRLTAIADLANTMDNLEIHLDGYTDRRGDQSKNITLANERIEKVRQQLISAGIEENRIISKAFGEAKMKSSAGDLEAYTFDRRVVIRFERIQTASDNSMAKAITGTDTAQMPVMSPMVADVTTRF